MMTSKTDGEVNEGQNLVIIYIDTTGRLKRLSRCLLIFMHFINIRDSIFEICRKYIYPQFDVIR